MNIFKKLYYLYKHHDNPRFELIADYENLIRLARRCAYDLSHVVDYLPENSVLNELGMRDRSDYWLDLFRKGNPGKDYRTELLRENQELNRELDIAYAELEKLSPKSTNDSRIPF